MDQRDRNDFFDQLLEAGLARYAGEEPLPGLERRILEKALARRPRERWGWSWALAAATATLALAGFIFVISRRPSTQPRLAPRAADSHQATGSTRERPEVSRAAPRLRPAEQALTRPERFPAPAPLTEQEKLLLLYVKLTPKPVLAATADHRPIEDLRIDDLTVPELKIKELPGARAEDTT